MNIPSYAFAVFLAAAPALAADIPEGFYVGMGDGARMTMTVASGSADIAVGSDGCFGGGSGAIQAQGPDRWRVMIGEHALCVLDITRKGRRYEIAEDPGTQCSQYHGGSCSLSGYVEPTMAATN